MDDFDWFKIGFLAEAITVWIVTAVTLWVVKRHSITVHRDR